jgi:hypothetical protein
METLRIKGNFVTYDHPVTLYSKKFVVFQIDRKMLKI